MADSERPKVVNLRGEAHEVEPAERLLRMRAAFDKWRDQLDDSCYAAALVILRDSNVAMRMHCPPSRLLELRGAVRMLEDDVKAAFDGDEEPTA